MDECGRFCTWTDAEHCFIQNKSTANRRYKKIYWSEWIYCIVLIIISLRSEIFILYSTMHQLQRRKVYCSKQFVQDAVNPCVRVEPITFFLILLLAFFRSRVSASFVSCRRNWGLAERMRVKIAALRWTLRKKLLNVRNEVNVWFVLYQRGPTTSDLGAILQKRDSSLATSSKMMSPIKQQIHNSWNWKREDKWVASLKVSGSLKQ